MIVEMARLRIIGPRDRVLAVLRRIQDIGEVHLDEAATRAPFGDVPFTAGHAARVRQLEEILEDVEALLRLAAPAAGDGRPEGPGPHDAATLARWARLARRLRGEAESLSGRIDALEEERALLNRYRPFLDAFAPVLEKAQGWSRVAAYHVLLRRGQESVVAELELALERAFGRAYALVAEPLPGGETGLLLLVPRSAGERLESILAEASVEEMALPAGFGGHALRDAYPRLRERLMRVSTELEEARDALDRLLREHGETLLAARSGLHDALAELEALRLLRASDRAFLIEGWIPAPEVEGLRTELQSADPAVVVETVDREEWVAREPPVVLHNPRLLRPFETLLKLVPLPRYGTIDPTPFVAVFFPMFFGLILGDIAYGLALAGLGLWAHRRSEPDSVLRAVSEVAGACAVFTIIFGFLYGELLGDAGRRLLGLRPFLFDREEALVPFLGLAVALGAVHVLLGLGLGVVSAFRGDRRHAVGRGLTALLVVLVALAILAAVEVLPGSFFTPLVVLILIAFPVLVVAEGILAPVELVSTLGHILSYARVMAVGTASVMMAVVANRLMGAMGSVVVGALFALLFHLVNFGLGLFSPTLHALRLHYVEFFGTFYSPGGTRYRPFTHWAPDTRPAR